MKHQLSNLLGLLTLLMSHCLMAMELPQSEPVPGGIAVIRIGAVEDTIKPRVHYTKKPVMLVQHNRLWYAIIGIPLDTPAGNQTLEINTDQQTRTLQFAVKAKAYEAQYLTIKNKRKVNPEKRDLKRITIESRRMRKSFNHFDETIKLNKLHFSLPVEGIISSQFGLRRYFNKQPRRPHSGLDIAADIGTAIHAPLAGKITELGDFFFNGNTVMIDHGQGLISMYCHMNKIAVVNGQHISQGDIIGSVGMTGRVTGPHLHWSISLNNTRIDPILLLDQPALLAISAKNKTQEE